LHFIVALFAFSIVCGIGRVESSSPPDGPRLAGDVAVATLSVSDSAVEVATPGPDGNPDSDAQAAEQGAQSAQQSGQQGTQTSATDATTKLPVAKPVAAGPVDANGNEIPLERRQPTRILGFMPNFRTVSGGAKPPPPSWKYNFSVATHQATDYSSFIFLGLTSLTAEGLNQHPALGKGIGGFYAYNWRGFLDKTDNTYLSAFFYSSLLHEDTRYYAFGQGHSIPMRILYVISRQGVARTYGGHQTPNFAGLGAKVTTQFVSRYYYPASASTFPVLATKFGYSVMRDVIFSSIREFYPDLAAHFVKKRREKMERLAAKDAGDDGSADYSEGR
jgi:hypothetical protein